MRRDIRRCGLKAIVSNGALVLAALSVSACEATLTVNATHDAPDANPGDGVCETAPGNGVCTLRAAIQEANVLSMSNNRQGVNITLPAGRYILSLTGLDDQSRVGDLDVRGKLFIAGADPETTVIDGGGIDRVFDFYGAYPEEVSGRLSNVTLTNGRSASGGAAIIGLGAFEFNRVKMGNNSAPHGGAGQGGIGGGALLVSGKLTMTDCSVMNNTATGLDGGGIYVSSSGDLTMVNGTIGHNSANFDSLMRGGRGGGVFNDNGRVTITNGAVSWNSAESTESGSAIHSTGGQIASVTLKQTLVNDNRGYGVWVQAPDNNAQAGAPTLLIEDGTMIGNLAAIVNRGGKVALKSSLIVGKSGEGAYGYGVINIRHHTQYVDYLGTMEVSGTTFRGIRYGAAVWNMGGDLKLLSGNELYDNRGGPMGGQAIVVNSGSHLIAAGTMTIRGTTIRNNVGGGVYGDGNVLIDSSTISGTTLAPGENHTFGVLVLAQSDIVNSTISGNQGTGVEVGNYAALTVSNSTIAFNIGGLQAYVSSPSFPTPSISAKNSILAANLSVSGNVNYIDCLGTITSAGYNILGNSAGCTFSAATGDQVGSPSSPIDPKLGPLQANGGPTPTHAVLAGSPARAAGNPSGCTDAAGAILNFDQRSAPRPAPAGTRCDVGAYESL